MIAKAVARVFGKEEGVTLQQLVRVAVALYGRDRSEWDAVAAEQGIPAGRYEAIADAWKRRMQRNPAILQVYHLLYQRAMRDAGVVTPDLSLEDYASIARATGSGTPLEEALLPFGIDTQEFALLAQRWGMRMIANPRLAMRYAELIDADHDHAHEHEDRPGDEGPSIQILG